MTGAVGGACSVAQAVRARANPKAADIFFMSRVSNKGTNLLKGRERGISLADKYNIKGASSKEFLQIYFSQNKKIFRKKRLGIKYQYKTMY